MADTPTVRMRANLPLPLAAKIEVFLKDPIRPGKRAYGEFSKITAMLWENYFNEIERRKREASSNG